MEIKISSAGAVCSQGATSHSKQVSDSRAHMLHNVPSEINLKKYRNSFHNNCTIIKIAMIQYIHKKIEEKKFTDHHNTSVKNVHTEEHGRPNLDSSDLQLNPRGNKTEKKGGQIVSGVQSGVL